MSSNRDVEVVLWAATAIGVGFVAIGGFTASGWGKYAFVGVGCLIIGLARAQRLTHRSDEPDPIGRADASTLLGPAGPSSLAAGAVSSYPFGAASPGYDPAQVADFLARVQEKVDELGYRCRAAEERAGAAEADLKVRRGTPLAVLPDVVVPPVTGDRDPIGPVRFAAVAHGWNPIEVDAFLRELGARISDLQDRYRLASERWRVAEEQLAAIDPSTR